MIRTYFTVYTPQDAEEYDRRAWDYSIDNGVLTLSVQDAAPNVAILYGPTGWLRVQEGSEEIPDESSSEVEVASMSPEEAEERRRRALDDELRKRGWNPLK
jgi:hypothetical protein